MPTFRTLLTVCLQCFAKAPVQVVAAIHLLGDHSTPLWKRLTLPNKKSYPVLLSQGILGDNLHDALSDPVKAKQLEKLDPLAFSELLLASMLVNFEDAKPDNFILERLPNDTYRLVGMFQPPLRRLANAHCLTVG